MIFIDTSYLLAMTVRSDGLHQIARVWTAAVRGRLLTTDLVILEFVNCLSTSALRARAHQMTEELMVNPSVAIEPLTSELFRAGLELHKNRPDKEWSLTDCVSFIVMQRNGASEALTHDLHFEQAGFRPLLRFNPE